MNPEKKAPPAKTGRLSKPAPSLPPPPAAVKRRFDFRVFLLDFKRLCQKERV